jgi:hypothetical protein
VVAKQRQRHHTVGACRREELRHGEVPRALEVDAVPGKLRRLLDRRAANHGGLVALDLIGDRLTTARHRPHLLAENEAIEFHRLAGGRRDFLRVVAHPWVSAHDFTLRIGNETSATLSVCQLISIWSASSRVFSRK